MSFQLGIVSILVLSWRIGFVYSENVESSYFFYQRPVYPRDCKEARDSCNMQSSNGVIIIKPDGYHEPFEVYCDHEVDSGGWTVIQRRGNGTIIFQRDWQEYKLGFGFLWQEFYLGNEKLSFLTNQNTYELRIDVSVSDGTSYYAMYTSFHISDEFSGYTLNSVGQYSGTTNFTIDQPTDCLDIYQRGNTENGVYSVKPTTWAGPPFDVYCNMTDGGGWTVFQRRVDGSIDFYVDWEDYKNGFGPLNHEHWLGNEKIFSLTNQRRYALRIDFVNSLGDPYFAKYDFFSIDKEINNYRLTVEGYSDGDAGDSLTGYNNNENFSTRDRDNDDDPNYHYALNDDNSAWWYGGNDYANYADSVLNGGYHQRNKPFWETLPGSYVNIQYTEMKIRPA